jgi:membrane protein DedA with SNARE-associated domain
MPHAFQTFIEWYVAYGYPVLCLGVLLENAGVPVPGEAAVLVAGFLASPAGGARFSLGLVIALAFAAAVLGDNLGFWLGRRFVHSRLQRGHGFLLLTPQALRTAESYFARYGAWTVFAARFVTGLRVVIAPAAGAAGMPWSRFFPANAAGAFAWASAVGLLGYFFGRSWQQLHHAMTWGSWIILGSAALAALLVYLRVRLGRRRRQTSEGGGQSHSELGT